MKMECRIFKLETILTLILILAVGLFSYGQKIDENQKSSRTQATAFTRLYDINPSTDGDAITEIVQIGSWLLTLHENGGTMGYGSILKIKKDGSKSLRWPMWDAATSDIATADTLLFGAKRLGGTEDNGLMFRTNLSGSTWTTIFNFTYNFSWPRYNFIVTGERIYGSAYEAFAGDGYLFSMNTDGSDFSQILQLNANYARVRLVNEDYIYGLIWEGEEGGNFPARIKTDGSESEVFAGPANPESLLMIDNLLYGITGDGGDNGLGTVWRMNPDGTGLEILHHFTQEEGIPYRIRYNGEVIYGVSIYGGEQSMGRIFRLDKTGTNYRKIMDFNDWTDGVYPYEFTVSGDTIYGLTLAGGNYGSGTIFRYIVSEIPPPPVENVKAIQLAIEPPEEIQIITRQDLEVDEGAIVNLDTTVTIISNIDYTYKWQTMQGGQMTDIDKIVTVINDGTYYILVHSSQGCTFTESSALRIKRITGWPEDHGTKNYSLYPNPNHGELTFEISNAPGRYIYEIFNMNGIRVREKEIVCSGNACQYAIALNNDHSGIYTFVVRLNGMVVYRMKFIVH